MEDGTQSPVRMRLDQEGCDKFALNLLTLHAGRSTQINQNADGQEWYMTGSADWTDTKQSVLLWNMAETMRDQLKKRLTVSMGKGTYSLDQGRFMISAEWAIREYVEGVETNRTQKLNCALDKTSETASSPLPARGFTLSPIPGSTTLK